MQKSISYQDIYYLLRNMDCLGWPEEPGYLLGCDVFQSTQHEDCILVTGTTIEVTIEDPMELVGEISIDLWGFPFEVRLNLMDKSSQFGPGQISFLNDLDNLNYCPNTSVDYGLGLGDWKCDGMEKVWSKISDSPHKNLWASKLDNALASIDHLLDEYEEINEFIKGVNPLFIRPLLLGFPGIKNWGRSSELMNISEEVLVL